MYDASDNGPWPIESAMTTLDERLSNHNSGVYPVASLRLSRYGFYTKSRRDGSGGMAQEQNRKKARHPIGAAAPSEGASGGRRARPAPVSGTRTTSRADLLDTIEHHVIPRLMLAHAGAEATPCGPARRVPTEEEVRELARRSLSPEFPQTLEYVEEMVRDGLSLESAHIDLIAPAARLLGDDWLKDERSFVDVTVGLATLHQLVNALRASGPGPMLTRGTVALVTAPLEQHTLGIHMLGELVRAAGWGAYVWPTPSEDELVDLVTEQSITLVGISVSCDDLLVPLATLVGKLKKAGKNPQMAIMLGGAIDLVEPAREMGALYGSSKEDVLDWLRQQRDPRDN